MKKIIEFNEFESDIVYIQIPQDGFDTDDEAEIYNYESFFDIAYKLAKSSGLNILSDKNLKEVAYAKSIKDVIGALFISDSSDSFSFDIVVSPEYRRQGIATKLVKSAISEYEWLKDVYGKNYKMKIDVVSSYMHDLLLKFKFKSQKIADNRWIMSK